jgi:hypothetical protein
VHRIFLFVCTFFVGGHAAWSRPFNFQTDTFAFANQTYFDYKPVSDTEIKISRRKGYLPDYSRHCFQLCRAVLQFYEFAEFCPDLPKVAESDYQKLVRRVSKIPVWSSAPREKVVFPGYKDLHSFSSEHSLMLEKNLGIWWPSFWRIGNWRIVFPAPRSGQERVANWLRNELDAGRIRAVYITRLKPINHCLIPYHYTAESNGDLIFDVYDANQPGKLVHLSYSASARSFYLDKTWYYSRGLVTVLRLYLSPLF